MRRVFGVGVVQKNIIDKHWYLVTHEYAGEYICSSMCGCFAKIDINTHHLTDELMLTFQLTLTHNICNFLGRRVFDYMKTYSIYKRTLLAFAVCSMEAFCQKLFFATLE